MLTIFVIQICESSLYVYKISLHKISPLIFPNNEKSEEKVCFNFFSSNLLRQTCLNNKNCLYCDNFHNLHYLLALQNAIQVKSLNGEIVWQYLLGIYRWTFGIISLPNKHWKFTILIMYRISMPINYECPIYIQFSRRQYYCPIIRTIAYFEVHENAHDSAFQVPIAHIALLPRAAAFTYTKTRTTTILPHHREERCDKKFVEWKWNAYRPAGNKKRCT